MKKFIIPVVLFCSFNVFSQEILPYKNPELSPDERAKDLLQRMTAEDKFWQVFKGPDEIHTGEAEKYTMEPSDSSLVLNRRVVTPMVNH